MIQLSAPSNSASAAKSNGVAAPASPNGAESGDFAALLGAAGSTADAPEGAPADLTATLAATLAGLPDGKTGKTGKANGKDLPVDEIAADDDLETSEAPDEAASDQADVPIAAAIPVLPLIVPPLPGTGNTAEFRAADPDPAAAPATAALPQRPTLPTTTSQVAQIATAAPVAQQAAAAGLAPAQVLQVKLAPIEAAEVQQAATSAAAQAAPISTTAQIAIAAPVPQQAPIAPPATENTAPRPAPAVKNAPAVSANTAPAAEVPTQDPAAPSAKAVAGDQSAAKATKASPSVSRSLPETGGELKLVENLAQPALHFSNTQTLTAPAATAASGVTAAPAVSEQPHDFATLVSRLSEAREAASTQVVSTALHHAEFGKISLQFRHDDANLSVTMANLDPAFTAAVHSAVAASLGANAGNSDQPRDGQQGQPQQQQQQAAAQQQSGSSGNGQGQQQAAQARAENGERTFNRGQAASARTQQGDSASPDRAETGARRSGIYA